MSSNIAWVPVPSAVAASQSDLDALQALAVDWIESHSAGGILVTDVHGIAEDGRSPVVRFGRRHDVTTPRSIQRTGASPSRNSVLAFAPDLDTLHFAIQFAAAKRLAALAAPPR
jgi:hypothetical protein